MLAVMTSDLRVFRCHFGKSSNSKISEHAGKLSNYDIIKEIIMIQPKCIVDVLLASVQQNRYWLVEKLLHKIYFKKNSELHHTTICELFSRVKGYRMITLIAKYVPVRLFVELAITMNPCKLELVTYIFQKYWIAENIHLSDLVFRLPDDQLEKLLDVIFSRKMNLKPEYLYITIAYNKQRSLKMLLKFKQFHNAPFRLITTNPHHRESAIKAYELLISNFYLTIEDIIKLYQNTAGAYIITHLLAKNNQDKINFL
jgi:hypothetical protein